MVQEVSFLKPIQDPEVASKKQSIVDVLCKDEKGVQYIVEMQVARTEGFTKRAHAPHTDPEELEKITGSDIVIRQAYK